MALSELLLFYQMHPVPAQELDELLCCFILVDTAWKISEKCFLDNSFWITHQNIKVRYLSIGTLFFSNVNVFKPPELNKTFIWFSLWLYLQQILLEKLSHHFQISIIMKKFAKCNKLSKDSVDIQVSRYLRTYTFLLPLLNVLEMMSSQNQMFASLLTN